MKAILHRISVFFIVSHLLSLSFSAFSQPKPVFPGSETLLLIDGEKAGKGITINTFDKARLEAEYLSVIKERDQRAYEFLFSSIEALHGGFKDLGLIVQELWAQSDQSLTEPVPVQRFMAAVRNFNQSQIFLNDKIGSLALLPDLRTDARKELSGILNFTPLKEHYLQQLESIKNTVTQAHFRLMLPSGAHYQQTGIDTANLKGMQLYSAEEMNRMHQEANKKMMMTTREQTVIDGSINTFTRKALETYIDVFGTSDRFRNSSDSEGRRKAAEALHDVFWARFYIRAVYGIKIGSIPVIYHKHIFNIDYLISNVKIGPIPLREESHLREALNQATEAEATLTDKNSSYYSSTLRHLLVRLAGAGAAENTKAFIIHLVKMDLEQELKLGKAGGLKEVRASYRQFYMATEEDKTITRQKTDATFRAENADDIEADVATIEAGTLRGVIAQCLSVLEQMERRLEEARQIKDSLNLLDSNNQTGKKRKLRAEL